MTTFIADYILGTRRRSRPASSPRVFTSFKSLYSAEGRPRGASGPTVPPDDTRAKSEAPSGDTPEGTAPDEAARR